MARRALLLAALAATVVGRPARAAEGGAALVTTPAALVAPTEVVVTASVAASEVVVGYDWGALPTWPRCRASSCALSVPVASCQRLEVAVTTELGETLTASAALCAEDVGGRPPQAELEVVELPPTGTLTVVPRSTAGSAAIVVRRVWIDTSGPFEPAFAVQVPRDGGCHAIDLLVGDADGRVAIAHRTVCTDPTAPVLWLGASGGAFPPVDAPLALCGEATHPLGLTLVRVFGEVPLDACTPERAAPAGPERFVVGAEDPRGVRSWASVLVTGTSTAATTLLLATLPDGLGGVIGEPLLAPVTLYGGTPPFTLVGTFSEGTVRAPPPVDARTAQVLVERLSAVGGYTLRVVVRDAHGLEAVASAQVTIYPRDQVPEPHAATLAGCSAVHRAGEGPGQRGAGVGGGLVLLALLVGRRRGGGAR